MYKDLLATLLISLVFVFMAYIIGVACSAVLKACAPLVHASEVGSFTEIKASIDAKSDRIKADRKRAERRAIKRQHRRRLRMLNMEADFQKRRAAIQRKNANRQYSLLLQAMSVPKEDRK